MATVKKAGTGGAANGEEKAVWVADYFDQHRKRHLKDLPNQEGGFGLAGRDPGGGFARRAYSRALLD